MEKTKVLFVSQEIMPYLPESEMSKVGRHLPQGIQEKGKEIRTFMPRYGCINERRNQLHEVIRLSGMNLIIDDTDHPLIIKVASIQAARMQVYFIDNDDYFHRKKVLLEDNGEAFADNDERAIFFARGVLETVKKLRWAPDVVHCQGWFTGLLPLYLKKAFNEDPLFTDTKVVFSMYDDEFATTFSKDFAAKSLIEGITSEDVKVLENADYLAINKLAIDWSDAIIMGSESVNEDLVAYAKASGKIFMDHKNEDEYVKAYSDLYDSFLTK
ncbi:glycogen/starch synthase [Ancylomarina sp. 16SWW S1-10-2]|uniref:glycogen/starch synthase n=1 Tax=Ancylomarina sp. 16SWW S1-10-2 TaxID=2499681 RepID=UPI0012AE8745|nr:glycogen/starch synthase [Ancylomarina sp. 16SWW S1-10-2]MRT92479.1 glycogen synthase [Ancylomarina sp. 16SWW S1-10-2]